MTNTEYFKSIQTNSETSSTSGETTLFSRTLLIFDFDDTLFCTKYFDTFSLSYQDLFSCKVSLEEINPCLVRELRQLESTIIEVFSNLEKNYDILIISNADMKWINNCLTHFLEEFKEYINENNIKIYSAKSMFGKILKNKNEWKIKCFKKVINDMYQSDLNCPDLNVISIGDSAEEKKAVFSLTKHNKFIKINPKFIRMISFPSAATIILQLKYLNNNLNNMIFDSNSNFKMVIEFKNNIPEIKCISNKKNKNESIVQSYLNKNSLDENDNLINLKENKENKKDMLFYFSQSEEKNYLEDDNL
jgi:hypothetical protein